MILWYYDTVINTPKRVLDKCLFWRSCEFLDVNSRSALKIHCQTYRFQPFTTLGGGVKKAVSVFFVSFGKKKLAPSSLRNSTLCYYDIFIWWHQQSNTHFESIGIEGTVKKHNIFNMFIFRIYHWNRQDHEICCMFFLNSSRKILEKNVFQHKTKVRNNGGIKNTRRAATPYS